LLKTPAWCRYCQKRKGASNLCNVDFTSGCSGSVGERFWWRKREQDIAKGGCLNKRFKFIGSRRSAGFWGEMLFVLALLGVFKITRFE